MTISGGWGGGGIGSKDCVIMKGIRGICNREKFPGSERGRNGGRGRRIDKNIRLTMILTR